MIQEFYITNFYSIRERQGLSFLPYNGDGMLEQYTHEVRPGVRLLKLGIVYGANASGKSTMLLALDFFRRLMVERPESKAVQLDFLPFLLDDRSRDEHSGMEMTFYVDGVRYSISLEFDRKRIYNERLVMYTSVRPTVLYNREYDDAGDHSVVTFGARSGLGKKSQHIISGNTINNCTVMAAFGQSNVEMSQLNKVYDYFSHNLRPMLQPKTEMMSNVKTILGRKDDGAFKRFLLQVLQVSDFNITDLSVTEDESQTRELVFRHTGDGGIYELAEEVESQGTKRFMGMALMLYELLRDNCFIPIDEVETSIHYELLAYFFKLFLANSEGTSQLLVTTHDINLLNENFIRRDVIWFTDKSKLGTTLVKHLSSLGLHKTLSPYNAYRQGKLVRLPFTGSPFLDIDQE